MNLNGGSRPSPAMVVALIALFVSLSGVAWAATSLPKASVKAKHIAADAVRSKHIKAGQVTANDIRAGAVNGTKLAAGAVGSAGLAGDAVDTSHVGANALGGGDIDESSLDGGLIPGVTVDESTIDGSQINDVNAAKLGGKTAADLQGAVRFAYVYSNGLLGAGRGVDSLQKTGTGTYLVNFDIPVKQCAIMSSLGSGSGAGIVKAGFGGTGSANDDVYVSTSNLSSAAVDNHFYVAVIC